MCHRKLKQKQILSCAFRDCDFNPRFVLEQMGYDTMLWKGTVLSSGWQSWRKICQVIRLRAESYNIPAFYLVKCVTAVNLAEMSSAGGAVVPASVVLISVLVQDFVSLFCIS